MAVPKSLPESFSLPAWEKLFYNGDRLGAEVSLLGGVLVGHLKPSEGVAGCSQIQRSYGASPSQEPQSAFAVFQASQPQLLDPQHAWHQLLPVADLPDALLFWAFYRRLPALAKREPAQRILFLQRLAMLLHQQLPQRPDLPFQVLMRELTASLLKSAPNQLLRPGQWYSRAEAHLPQLQVAWVQGRYESMWLGSLRAQIDGRNFPLSDHHIRGLSIIGEDERSFQLFQQLYNNNPAEFPLSSVSNLLFMVLGIENLPQKLIATLASHFHQLSVKQFGSCQLQEKSSPSSPKPLRVDEKPLLVVVSSEIGRAHV